MGNQRKTDWANIGLALAVLIPVIIAETLNRGRVSPVILPILLAGVILGARRQWPLWAYWWLGWTLFVAVFAILFWLPGPSRSPIIFAFWKLIPLVVLICIALALWQRGDGFRVAFTLFPWSLEFTRFILFDDLPLSETDRFLLMRVAAVFIYAGVITLAPRQQSNRTRWLVLITGALAYLIAISAISLPTLLFFIVLYPVYLPVLAVLASAPLVIGLGLDGYRARHHLPAFTRIVLSVASVLSIAGPLAPWLTGDALPRIGYAPLAAQAPGPRQAAIIDTDLSHDDYVAILYLLQRSDVDILGITVVDGIAHVEPGLENIQRLLATTGREDIPIAAGCPTPMVGENTFSKLDRLIVDSILRPALPRPATMTSTTAAPDMIRQLVADSPTPVNIIALGPLTNIAQALHDDPALASRLNTVIISGGTIGDSGTIMAPPARTLLSDWNILLDPQAADMVFRSGAPLTVIPLDVTNPHGSSPILVSEDFVARFTARARGQESQLMAHIMNGWLLVHPGTDAVPLWDAVVVAIAVDTNVCTDWRDLSIHITLEPAEPGQTVVDKNAPPNARACLGGDQSAFDGAYLATVRQ